MVDLYLCFPIVDSSPTDTFRTRYRAPTTQLGPWETLELERESESVLIPSHTRPLS